jgi:squalene-hopene/tetraprenyl-beta-curcumene cyclase
VKQGLDWLKSKQKGDGSWSNPAYPAMTALGLWAFTVSDYPDKADICKKAAGCIAGFAQKDGGIYKPATEGRGSGGLSTYNTAICMTALHYYDKKKYSQIILKAREFVAGSQLEGDSPGAGGFGYERPANSERDRADLSNTGWVLMSMRATQELEDTRPSGDKKVDVDWAAAMKFISKLQDQDKNDPENYGGFGYATTGERGGSTVGKEGAVKLRGFGSMTYAGLESMIYAQLDRSDPRVTSALQWASRHWSVDENPGMGLKGLFYYYTIMAKALQLAGGDTIPSVKGDPIPWKKQLVDKLVKVQGQDGNWVNQDGQFWESDPVLVTSYAILVLQKCGTN